MGPARAARAPDLTAATPGSGSVTLDWQPPQSNGGTPITGYLVYRGTTPGGETLLTQIGDVGTYTDSTAANGTTYFYKVAAVNGAGEGALSNERSATPATSPARRRSTRPPAATAASRSPGRRPSRTAAPRSPRYKVYRGTSAGAETLLTTVGNVTAYTDSTAVNGTTYFYKVSAVNTAGEGALSNELSATPSTNPNAPTLTAATPGDGSRRARLERARERRLGDHGLQRLPRHELGRRDAADAARQRHRRTPTRPR